MARVGAAAAVKKKKTEQTVTPVQAAPVQAAPARTGIAMTPQTVVVQTPTPAAPSIQIQSNPLPVSAEQHAVNEYNNALIRQQALEMMQQAKLNSPTGNTRLDQAKAIAQRDQARNLYNRAVEKNQTHMAALNKQDALAKADYKRQQNEYRKTADYSARKSLQNWMDTYKDYRDEGSWDENTRQSLMESYYPVYSSFKHYSSSDNLEDSLKELKSARTTLTGGQNLKDYFDNGSFTNNRYKNPDYITAFTARQAQLEGINGNPKASSMLMATNDEMQHWYDLKQQDDKDGTKTADKYLDDMYSTWETRYGQRNVSYEAGKLANEHPIIATIGSVVANSGPLGLYQTAENLVNAAKGKDINPYSWGNANITSAGIMKETVANNIDNPLARLAYRAGTSAAESMAGAAMLGGLGKAGNVATKLSLAATAMTSRTNQELMKGTSQGMAVLQGAIDGGIEYVTETLGGIDKFLDKIRSGDTRLIINTLKQMASEGAEEGVGDIFRIGADAIIAGVNALRGDGFNLYSDEIYNYERYGYMSRDEAVKQVILDKIKEIGTDTLIGGVSGGMMGGAATAVNYNNLVSQGREATTNADGTLNMEAVQSLIERGKNMPANTLSHRQAELLQQKVNEGKAVTPREAAVLYANNVAAEKAAPGKQMREIYRAETDPVEWQAAKDEAMGHAAVLNPNVRALYETAVEEAIDNGATGKQAIAEFDRAYTSGFNKLKAPQTSFLSEETVKEVMDAGKAERKGTQASDLKTSAKANAEQILNSVNNYAENGSKVYPAAMREALNNGATNEEARVAFNEVYSNVYANKPIPTNTSIPLSAPTIASIREAALKDRFASENKARANAIPTSTNAGVSISDPVIRQHVERGRLTDTIDFLNDMGKRFGEEITLSTTLGKYNGQNNLRTGQIVVAMDTEFGGIINREQAIRATLGHELAHRMRQASPKTFESFTKAVIGQNIDQFNTAVNQMVKAYEGDISRDAAQEEVIADYIGRHFFNGDVESLKAMVETIDDMPKRSSFIQHIVDLASWIKSKLTGQQADNAAKIETEFKKLFKETTDRVRQESADSAESVEAEYSAAVDYGNDIKNSVKVTDKKTLEFLENQGHITTYRTFQQIGDGLYAPMNAMDGKNLGYKSEIGQWEQATEDPSKVKNGQFPLKAGSYTSSGKSRTTWAAYNPYLHSSNLVFNDQFTAAYDRPNLVVVECEVPISETTSGYHADQAKDPVGWVEWKSGKVANALKKKGIERKVMLSRWMKPVRVLSNAEVAQIYKDSLDGTGIRVPWNVVSPPLRVELERAGVDIDYGYSSQVKASYADKFPENKEVKYSRRTSRGASLDSEGNILTEAQAEFFKDSKIRDENGNLLVMYHGTPESFTVFDPVKFGGKNGNAEGFGIYLSDSKEIMSQYGAENGITAYVNITHPAYTDRKTITKPQLKKVIQAICEAEAERMVAEDEYGSKAEALKDTWISNYTYTYDKSIRQAYAEVADSIYAMNENDTDIIGELINGTGGSSYEHAYELYDILTPITGIDGISTVWHGENGESARIAVAFNSNQIKNITNQTPTQDPDIRYSRRDSEGRTLTLEQAKFFAESKARDANGNLLVLYHGTDSAGFNTFRNEIWMTTSRKDAGSYGAATRTYDPNEQRVDIATKGGNFTVGSSLRFDTEQDRADFLKAYPEAVNYLTPREMMAAQRAADEAEDYDRYDELVDQEKTDEKIRRAYSRYEDQHSETIPLKELIDKKDQYTVDDFKRALLSIDRNAYFDDEYDNYETDEEFRDAIAEVLEESFLNEDESYNDFPVRVRIPAGKNSTAADVTHIHNRIYEMYANVTHPYTYDAKGRGSEGNGSYYAAVQKALDSDEYDGAIINNIRVGRYQELGTVVVAKDSSQAKLISNETPTGNPDIRYSKKTESDKDAIIRRRDATIDRLRHEMTLTHGVEPDAKAVAKAATELAGNWKVPVNAIKAAFTDIALEYAKYRRLTNQNAAAKYIQASEQRFSEMCEELAANVAKSAKVGTVEEIKSEIMDAVFNAPVSEPTFADKLRERTASPYEKRLTKAAESKERTRLLNIMKRLDKLANKSSAQHRAEINEAIGEFDLVAKGITKRTEMKLSGLEDWVNENKENPDAIITPQMLKKIERIYKRHISEITIEDVRSATRSLLELENRIRTENRVIGREEKRTTAEIGEQAIKGIHEAKGVGSSTLSRGMDKFLINGLMRPETEILRIVGFDKSNPLYEYMFGDELSILTGQMDSQDYQRQANENYFREFLDDKAFMETVTGKKARAIEITGTGKEDGQPHTVKVTPDFLMAMYMHAQNVQNLMHICEYKDSDGVIHKPGGMRVPDYDLYRKGKRAEAYNEGIRLTFTRSQLESQVNRLSDKEMRFIQAAQKYYSEFSKPRINEVSEQLVGYPLAEVDNYFRIQTDSDFRGGEFEALKFDGSLESMGWTKERTNSSMPIRLIPLSEQLQKDIVDHSKYVGLAIPIRNFSKIYGISEHTYKKNDQGVWELQTPFASSVINEINRKHPSGADTNYIRDLLVDLQNPVSNMTALDKIFAGLRSKYAGSVLTFNLGVALKQAASFPTAAAEIGWLPIIKTLPQFGKAMAGFA